MSLKMVLSGFLNHLEKIEMRRKLNEDSYELEFQKLKMLTESLKHNPDYSCHHGAQEINRCKNRYKDILPYDYTRVILTEDSDKPGSDYTNANYIKGATGSAAYIACQGPLPHTVIDFWRMIWECEVKVIIMACNEKEAGKQKCENYWPEDEPKDFGNFHVELLKTQNVCSDFLIRKLKATYKDEERTIYQFHYTTWPDHGVPATVEPILHLIQMVRKFQSSDSVPILVHCSAGCGRTGTICAIDYVWRLMLNGRLKEPFNLYEIISKMRQQRIAMVQTKEQYVLVHRAVAALFEKQLELIASHLYENIDEDGNPLGQDLNKEEEHIYEEVSCENMYSNLYHVQISESVKEVQHQRTVNAKEEGCCIYPPNEESPDCVQDCHEVTTADTFNIHLHQSDESHSKIPHSESVIATSSNNNADTVLCNNKDQHKNLDTKSYEQNANFTLSLPLSTKKGKFKNSDPVDANHNASIEDSVSCSVKIDNEGKVKILQDKNDMCLQTNSLPHSSLSAITDAKKETNCSIENQHCLFLMDSNPLGASAISCKIHQNDQTSPSRCSTEKCECSDTTFCERKYFTVEGKHADIEEIFLEILSDNHGETKFNSATSEKQHNSVKSSNSSVEGSRMDDNTSVNDASRIEFSNEKSCTSENVDCFKVVSAMHKENNNISDKRCNDTVLHSLMSNCTEASKRRYMSLVTQCEQSFSEIERLLEEKDRTVTSESIYDKEDSALPENQNSMTVYDKKLDNVVANDKALVLEDSYSLSVDKNQNLTVSKKETNSFVDDNSKQLGERILNTDSCNDLCKQSDFLVQKNDTTLEYTKLKCLGIEHALKMKQVNDGSLEYIDSIGSASDVHSEQETKHRFSERNFSEKSGKENVAVSKVSDAVPPDIKMVQCNVRTDIARKEGIAYKRTGKIFDKDDIFPAYNQEKLTDINSSSTSRVNDTVYLLCEGDKSQNVEHQVNPIVWKCDIDKHISQPNSLVASNSSIYNADNSEVCESENLVNGKSESSGGKVSVVRRPSITKLKALFEKTSSSDSNKQPSVKYPLSRSQSHRIHRNKTSDKDGDKERASLRPTLLDKVTKMLHFPSAENSCETTDTVNMQWNSSDVNETSFFIESKEVPRPVANAKESVNKSKSYNIVKDNSEPEKTNYMMPDGTDGLCNTSKEHQFSESIVEESAVGCLDISSLMSIVTKEQNINSTQWYEQEGSGQRNKEQSFSKKRVLQFVHPEQPEQMKEHCFLSNNGISGTKEKTDYMSATDNSELHHNQERVGNIGNVQPPKLPTKKKYQNTSFYSYIKDGDDSGSNLSDDSPASKTKWYFENDKNSSSCYDDCKDANFNLDVSIGSENYSNNNYQSTSKCVQESKSPELLSHTETDNMQPPLPPKKKNSDIEKAGKTDWYCKDFTIVCNDEKSKDPEKTLFHPYVNVLKTKEGIIIMDVDDDNAVSNQSKPDLYTNVNTTTMKNIEQIENSLQQHPRGAIIDLTSRQSYANEQHSDIKPVTYGSNPKLSETVITTDLEESHYNNEKPICDSLSERVSLNEIKLESVSLKKKTFIINHYETVWPQDKDNEKASDPIQYHNIRTGGKQNFVEHSNTSELEISNVNRQSPPSKQKLPSFGNFLGKSKSSSALCMKMREKNAISNEHSKFKDLYVNKVVCELNSILNGLTTKPFRSVHKDASSCSNKPDGVEMPQNKQSDRVHPLAPPRRKTKSDHFGSASQDADLELQGQHGQVNKNSKQQEKVSNGEKDRLVANVDTKPGIHRISKSKTMSDINKIKFADARKRNSSHSKETSEHFNRLPSVYENVDSAHLPTASLENDVQNAIEKKTSNKTNKLKHSCSDASVFSVLRRTKSLNKVPSSQDESCVSSEIKGNFKSEHKSYIKRPNPAASKQNVILGKDNMQQIAMVWENNQVQDNEQLTSHAKKNERRSLDDMDAFPVAPPRTRRHGPTPQKGVAVMKKFTSSLDEDVGYSKSQSLTRSTVTKIARNFEHPKLPNS